MKKIPSMASVMTPFPHSADVGASVDDVRRMLGEHDVHQLPVTDGGRLIGIVRARDLAAEGASTAKLRSLLRTDVYVVDLSARLDSVVEEMAERHHDAALVTKNDKLVGIFTATDACRLLTELLRSSFSGGGGNQAA